MEKVVALIPAAGLGRRMGGDKGNKQAVSAPRRASGPGVDHEGLPGKPLVDQVVPIVRSEEIDYCRRWVVERYGLIRQLGSLPAGPPGAIR